MGQDPGVAAEEMMVTETDVIRAVAEAKCPRAFVEKRLVDAHPITCPDCHGTGLRWPTLSRECGLRIRADFGLGDPNFPDARGERHPDDCTHCIGGRVLDVTLEKAMSLPHVMGTSWDHGPHSVGPWFRFCTLDMIGLKEPGKVETFYGQSKVSPLDALCAALLET